MTKDTRKLTMELKRTIIVSALNASPDRKAIDEIHKAGEKLADAFYEATLGDHIATIKTLPEGFLHISRTMRVVRGSGAASVLSFSSDRRVPASWSYGYIELQEMPAAAKKILDQWFANKERHEEARAKLREVENKLECALGSFSTVQRLIDAWPEIKVHVPEPLDSPKALAIPLGDLSNLLGLGSAKSITL